MNDLKKISKFITSGGFVAREPRRFGKLSKIKYTKEEAEMYHLVLYEVHGPPKQDIFLVSENFYGDKNTGKALKEALELLVEYVKDEEKQRTEL